MMINDDDDYKDDQLDEKHKYTSPNTSDTNQGSSTATCRSSTITGTCSALTQDPVYKMMLYLMQSYERTIVQERNFPKVCKI